MAKPLCSDADFERMFLELGPAALARRLQSGLRSVYARRERLENKLGRQIRHESIRSTRAGVAHPHRVELTISNGVVLVGSDAHIWPGRITTAMRAFIKLAEEMKPQALILNGDVMDFPQVSRHPPIGWEQHPTVADEISAARSILDRLEGAVPRKCDLAWVLGNHDSRLETRIATTAPELAKLKGVHLKDHFSPRWRPCWSVWINPESEIPCIVKHRYKGGIGATRANTLNAGTHMITGHLHSANVRGLNDYRKHTRWGVDSGCLADPASEAFVHYTEDGPLDWRSGFAVLTFRDGALLQPELVLTFSADHVQFRGDVIRV